MEGSANIIPTGRGVKTTTDNVNVGFKIKNMAMKMDNLFEGNKILSKCERADKTCIVTIILIYITLVTICCRRRNAVIMPNTILCKILYPTKFFYWFLLRWHYASFPQRKWPGCARRDQARAHQDAQRPHFWSFHRHLRQRAHGPARARADLRSRFKCRQQRRGSRQKSTRRSAAASEKSLEDTLLRRKKICSVCEPYSERTCLGIRKIRKKSFYLYCLHFTSV